MSAETYDPPLRVVPGIEVTKEGFARAAYLRELRVAAYTAFYKTMSLPRSVVRWGLGQLHRFVQATGSGGVLAWAGKQSTNVVGLVRQAGVVPTVVAVLSAPPVAAAAVRVGKFVGRGIIRVAKAAWTGIKSLLGRCGVTGVQITESLSHTGTVIAQIVEVVVGHPLMVPVVHELKATLALVRPVSQGFVATRLLAALVPVVWLRAVIAFLFMPLLVDNTLIGNIWAWATALPASPESMDSEGTDDGDLLINTLAIPMPDRTVPGDVEQSDVDEQSDEALLTEEEPFSNRASRRAQLREDAHAWRMQHR